MAQRIYTNVVALQKAGESFVFCYEDEDSEAVIKTLARFAANPDINFGWSDAAVLIQKVVSIQSDVCAPVVGRGASVRRGLTNSPICCISEARYADQCQVYPN